VAFIGGFTKACFIAKVTESKRIQKRGGIEMRQIVSELLAITESKKFTAYTAGVTVTLPTGESIFVKTQQTRRSVRPTGLRFSKYAFITDVTAGTHVARGFGEAPTRLLALQKSIAEAVERVTYRAMKGTLNSKNSNGWAAHINSSKAFSAALDELLERDAVLVHWLCQKPMTEISPRSWPKWLTDWTQTELVQSPRFKFLRVLISTLGYLPTVTTVLCDEDDHAVLSHSIAPTLEDAVHKALAETCRIGQIAIEGTFNSSSRKLGDETTAEELLYPEDHAVFYAVHSKLPTWIFGPSSDWQEIGSKWMKARKNFNPSILNANFNQIAAGPLAVGYCSSPKVQKLFFGHTRHAETNHLINFKRLREVGHVGPLNLMPHCVP
jgi:hypothetical protein